MPKRPELSIKVLKILEYGLKTHLSASPSSRKPKKGVWNALEHKSAIGIQEYHSALSKCWMVPIRALAQRFSSVDKTHLFRLFRNRTCPGSYSSHLYFFFLSIPASISRDWVSKFSTLFYASQRDFFHALKFLIFLTPLFWNYLSYVKVVLEALVLRISFL